MTTVEKKKSSACLDDRDLAFMCIAVFPKDAGAKADSLRFPIYWVAGLDVDNAGKREKLVSLLQEVLADPLLEDVYIAVANDRSQWLQSWQGYKWFAEKQFKPGVNDNLAKTVHEALLLAGGSDDLQVASGEGFLFKSAGVQLASDKDVIEYCRYKNFHPLTESFVVHDLEGQASAKVQERFLAYPSVSLPTAEAVQTIDLDFAEGTLDAKLAELSKQRVLALTVPEMKAMRDYFCQERVQKLRREFGLSKWPTDVELEIIAQTWSEHCKHKIFNATIEYTENYTDKSNGQGQISSGQAANSSIQSQKQTIKSLYKTYIQAATAKLQAKRKDLLSVFVDNAGVVKWNDKWAVCFKVETHNSPSALEPYGGALTGILGVNRDIMGTGLGAKPLFNTDVFCFAYPSDRLPVRPSLLPPETIINGVRKGVEDGGNKSGIPTVNGAVCFHDSYRAKPLVFCGTGGLLPLAVQDKKGYEKYTISGDTVVMAGGRVGKDGIHGATFSSEALHEGSPVSAVQIGDPFTQKRLLDFVLEARDLGLISGITDNGAGGLSSSIGEMAQFTNGVDLELDNIPLKYPGLADWEIVVSESQERMSISTRQFEKLAKLAEKHNVEVTDIGKFHEHGYFRITRAGKTVALLELEFLHKGVPTLMLEAEWAGVPANLASNLLSSLPSGKDAGGQQTFRADLLNRSQQSYADVLLKLLASPNISSREEIIRRYDHEVQAGSVIKPLMGRRQQAACDAAVIKPLYDDPAGLVVSNGICPKYSLYDARLMAICAVDEAIRNAVCVGADPDSISVLDNFCWTDPIATAANPEGKHKLAQLVRACQGLFDAVIAHAAPLISGKDSMKNDFNDGVVRLSVLPTLLVSAIGRLAEATKAVSMQFKSAGDLVYLLSAGSLSLLASEYAEYFAFADSKLPDVNLAAAALAYRQLHACINDGLVQSCHDLSEGGLAVALAECIIGSGLGADVDLESANDVALFGEGPAHLLITISPDNQNEWQSRWAALERKLQDSYESSDLPFKMLPLGSVNESGLLRIASGKTKVLELPESELTQAWKTPLPLN